jgi:hypothetical protein
MNEPKTQINKLMKDGTFQLKFFTVLFAISNICMSIFAILSSNMALGVAVIFNASIIISAYARIFEINNEIIKLSSENIEDVFESNA